MKATVTPINQRIVLQLNVAFVFEALILKRLRRLSKTRSHEWLRGLLVEGFKRECRAIRKVQRTDHMDQDASLSQDVAIYPVVSAAKHRSPMPQPKAGPGSISTAHQAPHPNGTVSFAMLRKVIG